MNEFIQLEGFERISVLISIIDDRLGSPTINENNELEYEEDELHKSLYDEKAKRLLATALGSLCELYQHIGEWGYKKQI